MKSSSEKPCFDYEDLQIARALHELPVPHGAKQRASRLLALAALGTASEAKLEAVASVPTDGLCEGVIQCAVSKDDSTSKVNSTETVQKNTQRRYRAPLITWLVAASLFLAAGLYFVSRSVDPQQLMVECSSRLDLQLQDRPNWQPAESDDLSRLVSSINLSLVPTSISQIKLIDPPLGKSGQLWKLTFENREDLYVFELLGAAAISGVGQSVEILPTSNNSWSFAAEQETQQLLVYATKGNLNQYLKLVALA